MVDLLQGAKRQHIRMSEAAYCRLRIAHNMLGTDLSGTKRGEPRFNDFALRMGSALEPMIAEILKDAGLSIAFDGTNQVEIQSEDPHMAGHPDGFIWLEGEPSAWIKKLIPANVIALLQSNALLLEIKTMRDEDWKIFNVDGLAGSPFLIKYIDQIEAYLGTINHIPNDELYADSTRLKTFFDGYGFARPEGALVVGFNTARKKFAFEYVPFKQEWFDQCRTELTELITTLRSGDLPEPDHDGKAPECFFCPYSSICPAVEGFASSSVGQNEAIIIEDELQKAALNEQVERYLSLKEEAKAIAEELKAAHEALKQGVGASPLQTDLFKLWVSPVAGRKTLDTSAVEDTFTSLGKELPYKTGESGQRLYIRSLTGREE